MSTAAPRNAQSKLNHEAVADRQRSVANAAYYLAEKRGFAPGQELQDWFEAEGLIEVSPPGKR